jgi:hypothetical protein
MEYNLLFSFVEPSEPLFHKCYLNMFLPVLSPNLISFINTKWNLGLTHVHRTEWRSPRPWIPFWWGGVSRMEVGGGPWGEVPGVRVYGRTWGTLRNTSHPIRTTARTSSLYHVLLSVCVHMARLNLVATSPLSCLVSSFCVCSEVWFHCFLSRKEFNLSQM